MLKENLLQRLKIPNPKYIMAQKLGYKAVFIDQFILNFEVKPDSSIEIPRGMLSYVLKLAKDLDEKIEIIDDRTKVNLNYDIDSSKILLRDYQTKALSTMVSNGTEGLLVSKAGSGKTVMGLCLVPLLNQRTLWITHTRPLATQTVERINQFLPSLNNIGDIGYIGEGKWEVGNVITIGLVQTLIRNKDKLCKLKDDFGLVICDEAHHAPSTTFTEVLGELNPYYLYGLTATPIRRDGLTDLMFQNIGNILSTVDIDEIVDYGGIIIPKVYHREINSPLPITEHDYVNILGELMLDNYRNNIIVSDVLNEATKGNICIVLTERKVHADILFKLLKEKWDKTGIATGNYKKKEINATIDDLNNNRITVLVATSSLLGEGFDHAPLNRGFLCLPIRNTVRIEQIMGRIQRTADGKKDAIMYDYVDNHSLLKHQFYNKGKHGCRYDVYKMLGAIIEKK